MRKKMTYALIALIALVSVGLMVAACGKGDHNPTGSDPVSLTPSTPASGGNGTSPNQTPAPAGSSYVATSGVCAGKVVYTTANGIMGFCELGSNLKTEGCVQINPEKTSRIFVKIGIVYKGRGGAYTRTAYFHDDSATCGPTVANNSGDPDNNRKQFKDGDILELWRPIAPDACGHDQWDGDIRDGDPSNRLDVLGVMLSYVGSDGMTRSCRTCEAAGLAVTVTGEGLTRTVKVTFSGQRADKKATVDFGDGSSDNFSNGETKSHTWPYGSYTVKASLDIGGRSPCASTATVSNEQPQSCANLNVQLGFCPETLGVTSTVSKCFNGSWVNPGTGTLSYGDSASDSVNNPFTKPHGYNQTDVEQNLTATLTVVRGQLSCPKTLAVRIPPKQDSCDNYTPTPPTFGGGLALTNETPTTETVTSGNVTPTGGMWSIALPTTVIRPAPGVSLTFSDTDTVIVSYGPPALHCTKSYDHTYTIAIPQQETTCVPTQNIELINTPLFCRSPFGGGSSECGFFGLVYVQTIPGSGTSWTSTVNAPLAIVKDGRGQCGTGESAYRAYAPVTIGQVLQSPGFNDNGQQQDISHVTICGCTAQAGPRSW